MCIRDSLGHPIVGDKLYCNEGEAFLKKWRGELQAKDIEQLGLPRHALHASELSLTHPHSHKKLLLSANIPPRSDVPGGRGEPESGEFVLLEAGLRSN